MSEPTVAWRPIEMLAEKDERIALLEGLLREARQEVVMPPLKERIDKALEAEK